MKCQHTPFWSQRKCDKCRRVEAQEQANRVDDTIMLNQMLLNHTLYHQADAQAHASQSYDSSPSYDSTPLDSCSDSSSSNSGSSDCGSSSGGDF